MRTAVRWVLAAAAYGLILFVAFFAAFILAWGCHHRSPGSPDLLCRLTFPPFGSILILGILVTCHVGATVLAVLIAPSHRRVVGAVAVLSPLLFLAFSMWGQSAVSFSLFSDVVAPILVALPSAIVATFLTRHRELRRVA
jgi:hypothetical protein